MKRLRMMAMIIDRLIDDYYWKELPDLITYFFKERKITSYRSLKEKDTTNLKITLNIIDNMINFQLSGKEFESKDKQIFDQLQEACSNNKSIELKDVLKTVEKIHMEKLHKRICKKYEDHLHAADVDEFIKFVTIYPNSIEIHRNLNLIWEACGQASVLSETIPSEKFKLYEKTMDQ